MTWRTGPAILTASATLGALVAPPAAAATPSHRRTAEVVTVAHRGASAYAPENTITAFRMAHDQHAHMFELDVQETKDHKLVLMHDTTLARTTNVERVFPGRAPWRVRDLTLAQVRKLDAGSWFGRAYRGERVPTLGETLRAMGGSRLGLLLEIKEPRLYPGIEARVALELRRHPEWLRPGRLVVQSFDWASMRRFHRLLPAVPVGLLGTPASSQLPGVAKYASYVNVPYGRLSAAYVRRVHGRHLRLFAWTVDSPSAMRRLISYKVDGIITDRPDVLHGVTSG
ncbi:glycerophosphodiester phosphodiesterase [Microbispora sp. ATCC PTA-5024]|uniref:glycerophosphodiester phosphodiesterase n=1 Tax=Microbispora sp. ATCC PTA-5024 TaxID=316330 RepID=UPI0003DBAFF4|nr:glycerophosphodiester phosphodiesterase family protein [Microbispora sp. ATCC PTA-5024]ETK34245.1 glycerophosphoryl diester phosphodiesterase [Microbispora sp. ATCC PTA-5024]